MSSRAGGSMTQADNMTAAPDSPLATLWCPSPNVEPRREGRTPDMLILHYTGMESADAALDWLTREESKVSAHYLVDEAGSVAQMVPEDMCAWHAGQSCWGGVPGAHILSHHLGDASCLVDKIMRGD